MENYPSRTVNPGERGFVNYLRSALTKDMVFLDIGANIGFFTVLAAPRAKEVVAVEPIPGACAVLWENIRRNKLDNVTVIETPLFSKVARGNVGRGMQLRITSDGPMETTTLDALSLAPNVIKIDASGSEYDILVGGEQTLRRYTPAILIDVYLWRLRRYGREWKHVYQFLQGLGYKITELEKCEGRRWILAERPQ